MSRHPTQAPSRSALQRLSVPSYVHPRLQERLVAALAGREVQFREQPRLRFDEVSGRYEFG